MLSNFLKMFFKLSVILFLKNVLMKKIKVNVKLMQTLNLSIYFPSDIIFQKNFSKTKTNNFFRFSHDSPLLNYHFAQNWKQIDFTISKKIQQGIWPELSTKGVKMLNLFQKEVCRLSLIGADKEAMKLVEHYSMKPLTRYLAINKVALQSGMLSGVDGFTIRNVKDKIILMSISKETHLFSLPVMKTKCIESSTFGIKERKIGICSMVDRVLQTQLCLVLDPYYEAKYPEYLYSSRKGRNAFQALGFFKSSLEKIDLASLSLVLINFENLFDNIRHEDICFYFEVPSKWRLLLFRWLKSSLFDKNGLFLKILDKGIGQGLIFQSFVRNVLFSKLFKTRSLDTFVGFCRSDLFKVHQKFFSLGLDKEHTENYLTIYKEAAAFLTTNRKEIFKFLSSVRQFFIQFGVEFSKIHFQVQEYFNSVPIKIEFLGFIFHYVPTWFLRKGGLLRRADNITTRKKLQTGKGTFIVYPCRKNFQYIKIQLKKIIRLLLRKSVLEVLTKLNFTIRVFVNYYSWSDSWSRLKTLDGFLFRYFKKYLIRKFRNRGIRKPVWVAKTFFLCKTKSSMTSSPTFSYNFFSGRFISPYLLRWHPHVKLIDDKQVSKYSEKVLFLLMPSKALRILSLNFSVLPLNVRLQPYYLVEKEFAIFSSNLYRLRVNSDNYKENFFIKQKGVCPFCKLALGNSFYDNFTLEVFGNNLQLYCLKINTTLKSTFLLHKNCYSQITSFLFR